MRLSKCILLLICLFSIHAGFSQTVTVTSIADNGPGTLRAALLAIPTIRTTPYIIHFNLPGAAPVNDGSRTIRLRSQLPIIPSNVVIDGSTQGWDALGVSGAKIIIEPENPGANFSGLVIGQQYLTGVETTGVEIYGLYIRNFATISSLQNVNTAQGSGIVLGYASGIKIGAPGKGNVISGNINGISIQNSDYYDNIATPAAITIQSNLIGVIYDGLTPNSNLTGISAYLHNASLNIGGDNVNEGNVISANQTNIDITRYDYNNTPASFLINIINNNIGTDISGKKEFSEIPLFTSAPSTSEFYGIKINSPQTSLYIRNNTVSGNRTWGISITNADFVLAGNAIGTDKEGIVDLGNGGGVRIETGATGTIGGPTAAEPNLIGYNTYGIESASERPVKITRNSMFCNTKFGIGKSLVNPQAYVQILKQRPNYVSGRATPNSDVELFYSINCAGTCEGKTYFKTVRAGSDGSWESTVPLSDHVVATASVLNNTTSEFSSAALLANEAIVEPVTCNGNGSISIPEPREGYIFTWNSINSDGQHIRIKEGTDQEITNLEVGSYEVVIDDGCKKIDQRFEIKDQKLTDIVPVPPQPACGQTSFSFGASVQRGKGTVHFQWKDADGNIVATTDGNISMVELPEGTYSVTATDDAGCSKNYLFARVVRRPKPVIMPTGIYKEAACGQFDGSIKGMTVADATGVVKYSWSHYDYPNSRKGTPVTTNSTNPDLENVAGGYYILEVTDDGGCSPAEPYVAFIQTTNSVFINGGNPVSTTCNNSNGAINNISITEGDTYALTTSNGVPVKNGTCTPGVPFDIPDLAAGTYLLNAGNSITQCTATPVSYIVGAIPITVYTIQDPIIQGAACDQNNGSIRLTYTGINRPAEGKYQWKNAAGDVLSGTSTEIKDLTEGDYTLNIIDENGCTSPPLGPFTVSRVPLLIVDQTSGTATDDLCGLGRGSVTGVRIHGGLPLSGTGDDAIYKYAWKDVNGNIVGTGRDLINIGAGDYYLEVSDQTESRCGIYTSKTFTISAPVIELALPVANDLRVCYATEIMVPVLAPEEGTYQLYKDKNDAVPILESNKGIFVFKVAKTGDYFVKRKLGLCESGFSTFHVEVTNDNLQVMNTITPNGDGMNDIWIINGLPEYGNIDIKLYTRSGQLIYESLGRYNKPFDGRFRGKELPAGVYYYRIDLRADCKPLGGSLTLLR